MEKIVFKLWKKEPDSLDKFKNSLLVDLPVTLAPLVNDLQINIADEDVNAAAALVQSSYPKKSQRNNFYQSIKSLLFRTDCLDPYFTNLKSRRLYC